MATDVRKREVEVKPIRPPAIQLGGPVEWLQQEVKVEGRELKAPLPVRTQPPTMVPERRLKEPSWLKVVHEYLKTPGVGQPQIKPTEVRVEPQPPKSGELPPLPSVEEIMKGINVTLVKPGVIEVKVTDSRLKDRLITLFVRGKGCTVNFIPRSIPYIERATDTGDENSPNAGWCYNTGHRVMVYLDGKYVDEIILGEGRQLPPKQEQPQPQPKPQEQPPTPARPPPQQPPEREHPQPVLEERKSVRITEGEVREAVKTRLNAIKSIAPKPNEVLFVIFEIEPPQDRFTSALNMLLNLNLNTRGNCVFRGGCTAQLCDIHIYHTSGYERCIDSARAALATAFNGYYREILTLKEAEAKYGS